MVRSLTATFQVSIPFGQSSQEIESGLQKLRFLRHTLVGLYGPQLGVRAFTSLYELASNSLRHGGCRLVEVFGRGVPDKKIHIRVVDDGAKPDVRRISKIYQDPSLSPGTGLTIVREFTQRVTLPKRKGNRNIVTLTVSA